MNKTYVKDGNTGKKGRGYCWKHFIEKYGREPNISDKARFRRCCDCDVV